MPVRRRALTQAAVMSSTPTSAPAYRMGLRLFMTTGTPCHERIARSEYLVFRDQDCIASVPRAFAPMAIFSSPQPLAFFREANGNLRLRLYEWQPEEQRRSRGDRLTIREKSSPWICVGLTRNAEVIHREFHAGDPNLRHPLQFHDPVRLPRLAAIGAACLLPMG